MNHVLITGGGSGIGAATARQLTSHGTKVSVLDRTGDDAESASWWHELDDTVRGSWGVCDVADPDALAAAVAAAVDHGATGLVACAGISLKEPFLDSTVAAWRASLDVNILGTAIAARSLARGLVAAGRGGAIVTVASTAGYGYVNGLGAHYHATKGAILSLTRALATELGPYGIRVNAVAPGLISTPITDFLLAKHGEQAMTAPVPQRALGEAAEVARAIQFLLSSDASMVTGHSLAVDGGQLAVAGHAPGGFPDIITARTAGRDHRPAAQNTDKDRQ